MNLKRVDSRQPMKATPRNWFAAGAQFPGQQAGKDLNEVRAEYTTGCKIYGQNVQLAVGNNPAIDINLPRDGRQLIGISVYHDYDSAAENPLSTLNINNTIFLESVGFRTFDLENLQSRMFYPLNISLSGNDRITLDINNVLAAATCSLNFHYI